MIIILSNYVISNSFCFNIFDYISVSVIFIKPFGPHIFPEFLNKPVRVYKPNLDRNLIGIENKERTIIYQWINLINGKMYVGSAWSGSRRLLSYWTSSVLSKNYPIYNSICRYTLNNFMLIILEDLGKTGTVTKEYMLSREQFFLDLLFNNYPLLILNNSPTAGTTLGFKHTDEFCLRRSGILNPMYNKQLSDEFKYMQTRDKKGINNPLFGTPKSIMTLAKITKLVYVYNAKDMSYIGTYSTVNCSKMFKMGKDTLSKYLKSGQAYKGKIYSRTKLHDNN
uniref:GIY-YIG endonuclease n=1 Tax=Pisolithus microcarpus TaxID=178872 RepID=A0A873QMA1_9AGAM|nr:GIY-YIG endonuclease [Pisolithus microcarpus]QPA36139.1 GIY-YIG endonuclease [Pisolithus microcarpus]